jgi:hypothetical protein
VDGNQQIVPQECVSEVSSSLLTVDDPRDVDATFFIATADLWSADGKTEQNLVLNTVASDRPQVQPRRRRHGKTSAPAEDSQPTLTPEPPIPASSTRSPEAKSNEPPVREANLSGLIIY